MRQITAKEIKLERPDPVLALDQLQVDLERGSQSIAVLEEPRGEIALLKRPDGERVNLLEPAEFVRRSSASRERLGRRSRAHLANSRLREAACA